MRTGMIETVLYVADLSLMTSMIKTEGALENTDRSDGVEQVRHRASPPIVISRSAKQATTTMTVGRCYFS
jgi:hypothetical protein